MLSRRLLRTFQVLLRPRFSPSWRLLRVLFPVYSAQLFGGVLRFLGLYGGSSVAFGFLRDSRSFRRRFPPLPHAARSGNGSLQMGRAGHAAGGRSGLGFNQFVGSCALVSGDCHLAALCAHHPGRDGSVPPFFRHYVGVSRRQRSFGIGLGFGSFAVIELVLIGSWVGQSSGDPWMSIVNMAGYNCSLLVWLGHVAVKMPARDPSLPFCSRSAGSRVFRTRITRCRLIR